MSTPNQYASQKWKSYTLMFAVLFLVMLGVSVYALAQNNSLNNDKTNLQNSYNTLKTTDDANVQKIDSLNANIATLNTQISTLQAQQTANLAQITHLQGELLANYTLLQNLESPNMIVLYHYIHSDPSMLFGCLFSCTATLTDATWANLGTITASNVVLTVSFYDSSKSLLCTITQDLTMSASGQSINTANFSSSCSYSHEASLDPGLTTAKITWS